MSLAPLARKWHRRLSVLVGVQLLLWTVSGFVCWAIFLPIEEVRGNHLVKGGEQTLVESVLAEPPALSEQQAIDVAVELLKDPLEVISAALIEVAPNEYRGGPLPAWQINFEDDVVLYLDSRTAKLHAVRTTKWRVFDFLWMLHIMDYDEREDFNHPLLIIAASFGVLTSLSGLLLTWFYYRRKWKA